MDTTSPLFVLVSLLLLSYSLADTQPIVSIIMSSYNRGLHLKIAIQSIIEQTFSSWELIIVDDGSHDGQTLQILEFYSKFPNIKVYLLLQNFGSGIYAKNFGFHIAVGKYLTIFDDDDVIYPNALQQLVGYMEGNSQIDAVVGFASIARNNEVIRYKGILEQNDHEVFKFRMIFANIVSCCAQLIRMETLRERFVFDYVGAEDYELYIRLLFETSSEMKEIIYARIPVLTCKVLIDSNDRLSDTKNIVDT